MRRVRCRICRCVLLVPYTPLHVDSVLIYALMIITVFSDKSTLTEIVRSARILSFVDFDYIV